MIAFTEITAYRCSDGKLFESRLEAEGHDIDRALTSILTSNKPPPYVSETAAMIIWLKHNAQRLAPVLKVWAEAKKQHQGSQA